MARNLRPSCRRLISRHIRLRCPAHSNHQAARVRPLCRLRHFFLYQAAVELWVTGVRLLHPLAEAVVVVVVRLHLGAAAAVELRLL